MATLYRKYRSKTFDEVIGQEPIVTTLTNQVKLGRIGHAYLFTGSRGTGKTTCARIFARAINCLDPKDGSPCGKCEACKALEAADCVDIIEMDAASNNGVDDARDIREKVKYLPVACKYKVYIIDEVHMLTGGAFNALLKTIEEPPEHVVFILATTEPQKLPQTILSRCIRFDFRLVPTETIANHIAKIYDAEGIRYTREAVEEIARQGAGSVRDALSVADTLMSAAELITPEVVLALTGASDDIAVSKLFACAASGDVKGALGEIDAFSKSGKSMAACARKLVAFSRNVLVAKAVGASAFDSGLINASLAAKDSITSCADRFDMPTISRVLEAFGAAESGIKYSVDPRVYMETAIVKLIYGAAQEQDLRRRVAALEKRLGLSADTAEQKKNKVEPTPSEKQPEKKPPEVKPTPAAPAQGNTDIDDVGFEPPPEEYPLPPPIYEVAATEKPMPVAPKEKSAPPQKEQSETAEHGKVTAADEGEFMHLKGKKREGLGLLGKIASYLRKKGTYAAARAHELLSRGVVVKEREDVIGFVVSDENFLTMTDKAVIEELTEALKSLGIQKPPRPEKTEEDLYADDLAAARELFGRDHTIEIAR